MLTLRKSAERGHANHGWLESYHTFSFAQYRDPRHMGFRALRVINEDRVQPGQGFPTHGHRDMEIVTYVLEGALEHEDDMGNGSVIRPGDVQYMSAGTGVLHSEYNASDKELVHFMQIWIEPSELDAKPRYGQKSFASALKKGGLVLLASQSGEQGSIALRADAKLYAAVLDPAARDGSGELSYDLAPSRAAWLHVLRGALRVDDTPLATGDAVAVERASKITLHTSARAEALLFDLA
jgi:redox-sensitive bicupin YhaK (pirin superfamily)